MSKLAFMSDPNSFAELYGWIMRVAEASGSQIPPLPEEHAFWKSPGDVMLWFVQYEGPHVESIDEAVERIWMHGVDVFADLQPEAASLLRLRIETVAAWIWEFVPTEETPFSYPDADFRDLVQWLLGRWWELIGRGIVHREFLLRSMMDRAK